MPLPFACILIISFQTNMPPQFHRRLGRPVNVRSKAARHVLALCQCRSYGCKERLAIDPAMHQPLSGSYIPYYLYKQHKLADKGSSSSCDSASSSSDDGESESGSETSSERNEGIQVKQDQVDHRIDLQKLTISQLSAKSYDEEGDALCTALLSNPATSIEQSNCQLKTLDDGVIEIDSGSSICHHFASHS